ncbi:MAG: hypothetical protein ACUVS5_08605 [Anaerolineae bacterium]
MGKDRPHPRVDDLFRVRGTAQVAGRTVHLRTISAADNEDRMAYALELATALRRALLNPETEEYKKQIAPLASMPDSTLVDLCVMRRRVTATIQAMQIILPEASPEPPERGTVAQAAQAELDDEAFRLDAERRREQWVEEELARYREHLRTLDREALVEEARQAVVDQATEREFIAASDRHILHRSCYWDPDCKKPVFPTPEDAAQADRRAYETLVQAYRELDRFYEEPEALKNSR